MIKNLLLNALTEVELSAIQPHLKPMTFELGHRFFGPGDTISEAWFVEDGVVSLVTMLKDGAGVEAATVGAEGAITLATCLTGAKAFSRAVVQIPGSGFAIACEKLREAAAAHPHMSRIFYRYLDQLLAESQQSAACNAHHRMEPRLSKWLLRCHDRVGSDTLPLTQEFLGHMLGAQRTTVTAVLQELSKAGAIQTRRARIEITDRAVLETLTCECYGDIRRHAEELGLDLVSA
ncbi:MAG: Crp/Fnr family transcriptional regulator [Caulobacteraceae bacterium]